LPAALSRFVDLKVSLETVKDEVGAVTEVTDDTHGRLPF
jgi:hypothetical protein